MCTPPELHLPCVSHSCGVCAFILVNITDLGGYLACSTNTKLATPSALHVGAGDNICLILLPYSNLLHGQGGASTLTTGGSRNLQTPPADVARIVSVNLSTSSAC